MSGIEDSRTHNKSSYLGYKEYSKIDVVSKPDLISNSLIYSADSGGWFWKFGKMLEDGSIIDMNTIVKIDNIERVSKLVNGGSEALTQRKEAFSILNKIFPNENCINKV